METIQFADKTIHVLEDTHMQNLTQLSKQVKEDFADLRSYVVPTRDVRMTDAGRLSTGKNEFPVTLDGLDSLAENADIPKPFFQKLPSPMAGSSRGPTILLRQSRPGANSYCSGEDHQPAPSSSRHSRKKEPLYPFNSCLRVLTQGERLCLHHEFEVEVLGD